MQAEHRIYAVGDIHGRADLLAELLEKIWRDSAARSDARLVRYVFLGDYVDRGEHTKEVLDILCELQASLGEAAVFLRGNHEAMLLDFLDDPLGNRRWLEVGGAQTVRSYGLDPSGDLQALQAGLRAGLGRHLAFLQQTERFWQSGGVAFVHAAIDPSRALAAQEERDLLWGNAGFLRGRGQEGLCVIHGHYDGPEPVVAPHRICVDTGAYYSDRLTAVCLDGEMRFLTAGRG